MDREASARAKISSVKPRGRATVPPKLAAWLICYVLILLLLTLCLLSVLMLLELEIDSVKGARRTFVF